MRRTSIKIQVTGTNMPSVTHPLQAAALTGHDAFVEGVEFSSNGKYIMSSSSGKLQLCYANHGLSLFRRSLSRFHRRILPSEVCCYLRVVSLHSVFRA